MKVPQQLGGVNYGNLIAHLCKERRVRRYMEVGVQSGLNLARIECDVAVGIDPGYVLNQNITAGKKAVHLYQTTSDLAFAEFNMREVAGGAFDLVFLDGMHLFEYLLRDFYNSERLAAERGVIAIHDCMPLIEEMISRTQMGGALEGPFKGHWTGDVWKIVPILKKFRPDLTVHLLDCPPTGLVLVTGLDPSSTILRDNYLDIVREFVDWPNDANGLEVFYSNVHVVDSRKVMQSYGLFLEA